MLYLFTVRKGDDMTPDDLRQMALKAQLGANATDALAKFAALVMDACARKCDRLSVALDHSGNTYRREATASQCASAIRRMRSTVTTAADNNVVLPGFANSDADGGSND